MSDQPRPVWPTKLQRDLLADILPELFLEDAEQVRDLVSQWDAAPADATEAVHGILLTGGDYRSLQKWAKAVLRALGMPQSGGES